MMEYKRWLCVVAVCALVCFGGCTDEEIFSSVQESTQATDTSGVQTSVSTADTTASNDQTTASTTRTTVITSTTAERTGGSTSTEGKQSVKRTTTAKSTTVKKTTFTSKTTVKIEQTTATTAPSAAAMQQEVFRLVNAERAKAGLPAVQYYTAAQAAADLRAAEVLELFSHTRPNGSVCFTVLDELEIDYRAAGENIALGHTSAAQVMDAWMNSDGHRSNILNEDYNAVVVGYHNNGWVQLFLKI